MAKLQGLLKRQGSFSNIGGLSPSVHLRGTRRDIAPVSL
jgi:hypothetical protein